MRVAMHTLLLSVRHGARTLRSQPGFTAGVVLTLGLGIAANCALFTVVNGLLLRPLPYRDPAGLVEIALPRQRPPLETLQTARSFSGIASFVPWGHSVQGPEGPTYKHQFAARDVMLLVRGKRLR